ncbi:MAG TPA: primosomal protein N' [Firmicutes bacterium]|nr:primosomal protein N' [Bacillota bacterium]
MGHEEVLGVLHEPRREPESHHEPETHNEPRYASVMVDIAVDRVNRPFHYAIPDRLAGRIDIGTRVIAPFGNRTVYGYVIDLVEEPFSGDVKELIDIADDLCFLDRRMLDLARWMQDYYLCHVVEALRCMLPGGVRTHRVRPKFQQMVELAPALASASQAEVAASLESLGKTAPSQARVLKLLLAEKRAGGTMGSGVPKAELLRRGASAASIKALERKGLVIVGNVEIRRAPMDGRESGIGTSGTSRSFKLTREQASAVQIILDQFSALRGSGRRDREPRPVLLHGVTGSGKTEVYLQAIAHARELGRSAIVLVPEISLTPQMVERFCSRFGDDVAVLHSRLSMGERFDEWRRIRRGEAGIVIGARSAIFAPARDLGLIIIDEEHEASYKQDEAPRYDAREVARVRAKVEPAVLVLGSATPSIEAYHRAMTGEYTYARLPDRVSGRPLPAVHVIDLREELKAGNRTIFSRRLREAIADRLTRREQIILFLNRRGHSTFVLCRECGHVLRCPHCDVSLTYHAEDARMLCHYCDWEERVPEVCPRCGSIYIKYFGIGTERVEREVKSSFPGARVLRMDVDTTRRKGSHRRMLDGFRKGEYDILVGTQMIAKGLDFPGVTLVGVVTADTSLNLPDFRSGERTFQLLEQVAGRAGRGASPGEVIIQTYSPDHYSIRFAASHDYEGFYREEIKTREELVYPPFAHIIAMIVSSSDVSVAAGVAQELASALRARLKAGESSGRVFDVLGPAPCPLARIGGSYRWQVALKCPDALAANPIVRDAVSSVMKAKVPAPGRAGSGGGSGVSPGASFAVSINVDPASML